VSGRREVALGAAAGAWVLTSLPRDAAAQDSGAGTIGPALRALYLRFVSAQNVLDLDRVRAELWASPDFLWVSDGRSYWGPDAMLERMKGFQSAELWRVEPDLNGARTVVLGPGLGYLSLRLVLVIGTRAAPDRLGFLVQMLGRQGPEGWRIAALLTTEDKAGEKAGGG